MRLNEKVAVITGGASGMGWAATLLFAREGARVVAVDLNDRNGELLLAAAAEAGLADSVRYVRANVSVEADIENAVATAVSTFGQLDIMCNNAGIGGAFGPVTEVTVEDWDETFAVLVRGVFLGVKHSARQFRSQGWGGAIINTASVAGLSGGGSPITYAAAKAAVINLTRAASLELAPDRIRVNAICPGLINTPLALQGRPEGSLDKVAPQMQPWPDVGQPEDIAHAMLFLASSESRFITGEALVVDGGLVAAGPSPSGLRDLAPKGWVGMNRGTTGQGATVRKRGDSA